MRLRGRRAQLEQLRDLRLDEGVPLDEVLGEQPQEFEGVDDLVGKGDMVVLFEALVAPARGPARTQTFLCV